MPGELVVYVFVDSIMQWQRTGPGQCFDADSFYRVTSGLKVVIDLVLVVLPLQPLWKLQVTKIRKIGTTVVFLSSVM